MNDKFDFREAEPRLTRFWEEKRVYRFDEKSERQVYAIDTPPPTMSGLIHLGHAFSYSQADFVARYKRMRGYNVFYPFGFDNNGLPTELLVEKVNNTTAEKVGREEFVKMVDAETKRLAGVYREVWTSIGISVDWSLLYATISADVQKASQKSFIELCIMGREYRKETPTIWCPKEGTALSQMELKDRLLKSKFIDIRFDDGVVIATTRPEMLPACAAIFINPEDMRAKELVGRKVRVPIFGQEVGIIADRRVDPEKGTGLVMCCTFGDLTDIEWYKAYGLELRIVMDQHGRMTPEYFGGMKVRDAREHIIGDLREKGYVVGEREIEHTVNVHERCNTVIEFLVKKQWFIRYLDMKDKLLELGRQMSWHPEHMRTRYENWINGLQWDWSISRQRYYGIPFPVWYCKKCDEPVLADEKDLPVNPLRDSPGKKCPKCGGGEMVPEQDILDTWATSSLTPLINSHWAADKNLMDTVYPMSLRPQAHDIISFWLFTTVVKCYLHTGKVPWKDILISGHGLDSNGMPMHKSAGNIIEPKVVIERYGADPLRHWASLSKLGDDSSFQEKDVITGARMVNKLWNVAKFVEKHPDADGRMSGNVIDRWIYAKALEVVRGATGMFDEYNYAGAKRLVDEFFWSFCDNYIEFIKYRAYGGDGSAGHALNEVFLMILKMMAPFMPYITEEIYLGLYRGRDGAESIHLSKWPDSPGGVDPTAMDEGERVCAVITHIRQWKQKNKMALNAELSSITISSDLGSAAADVKGAMNIRELSVGEAAEMVPGTDIRIGISR